MNYVIIGNGVAGTTAAEHIRKLDSEGKITIISDEKYPFYSRIRLIDFLAGTVDLEQIVIKKDDWYQENQIELILNDRAIEIDTDKNFVKTQAGLQIDYDKLLLATGANSFVPPIPGAEKIGAFTLRRFKDAEAIKEYSKDEPKSVVVIGGGVLGLEAGNALRKSGHSITVIEAMPRLLPRQMDPEGSEILKQQMENMGFTFYIGRMTKEITGGEVVTRVLLDDGTEINCDMIIISAGVRPELTLANQLKLKVDKGVVVNDNLGTELPDIYCAGDLINHKGRLYGIWPAAEKQGEIAGINMASGKATYEGTTSSNVLKVVGIDLVSIGEIDAEGKFESSVEQDPKKFIYKKLVFENNKIIGAILYGDKKNWLKIKKAIESKQELNEELKALI